MSNDNHIDRLQRLAKAQDSGPRSARDLAVLEAAKTQAAINRQRRQSPWFQRPLWIGAGSGTVLASAIVVFLLVGQPDDSDQSNQQTQSIELKMAKPDIVNGPVALNVPKPQPTESAQVRAPSEKVNRSVQSSVPKEKQTMPNVEIQARAPEKPVGALLESKEVENAPAGDVRARNADVAIAPSQTGVMSKNRAAPAAAAAPLPSPSNSITSESCLGDLRALSEGVRNNDVLATRRSVDACVRKFPSYPWPEDLQWIKQITPLDPSN
jgi:hypothetical protein